MGRGIVRLRLFVGLPLDAVSDGNTVNHGRAISAGLKALKLLGVEEMVQKSGSEASCIALLPRLRQPRIPLPKWVMKIGESQSNIFFTDRSGQQYRECLSLAVDDLAVLDGKTPIQVYRDFCESFKSAFSPFIGSTITGISMGLGPDGELRYPSHHKPAKSGTITGVGEFRCYDTNMLNLLKQHAEANGNPLWGLGGPHDAPTYDEAPNNFFNDHGGSWESAYGDFFLSWYSSELLSHGIRLLSIAFSIFGGSEADVYGKVPLMHSCCRDVCKEFMQNHLAGMDLSDEHQPHDSLSSPESLLAQIQTTCNKHGVEVAGHNLTSGGLEQIKKNMLDDLPSEEGEATGSVQTSSDPNIHLQTA
ncbi:Inactive beta-amylase 9 [Hibiscus syriacus]|uniref:Beta-amylase n=1 Tax=Hibiscus syriacus TaxID=106335 RepID=A0A6A2ZBF2_HIBSY|nr:Inactive beta-amylase 9 [Hibiscus syriacus]